MSEWLLFNAKYAIFLPYNGENKLHSMNWNWCPRCTRPTRLDGLLVLSHWNSSSRVDIFVPHIIRFRATGLRSFFEYFLLSGKETNTNFSLWFNPTVARTHHPPHFNHYAAYAVISSLMICFSLFSNTHNWTGHFSKIIWVVLVLICGLRIKR